MSQDFYKNSKLLGIWTKVSRILGLIRDNMCGRMFGTSLEFGAFTFAFRIPNLFRRLFGEGALSAAFIPQLVDSLEKEDQEKSIRFASTIFSITLVILSLICSIGIIICLVTLQFFTITEEWRHILKYSSLLMPFLIFICLTALLGSILNVLKHFLWPALMPVLFNLIWILALIVAWKCYQTQEDQLTLLCIFITLSGVIQAIILIGVIRKFQWRLRLDLNWRTIYVKNVLNNFLPVTFSLAIFQINVLLDGVIAVTLLQSEHALAALYYSDRIQQLPLGIISTSIATALYPLLSKYYSQNNHEDFKYNLTKALRGLWFLTIPCFIGILFLSTSLVQVFFSFKNPESTQTTASALSFYTIGLIFTCTIPLLTRAFYARGEMKTPVIIGMIMVALNCFLNLLFVFYTDLQASAIALATSICSILNVSIMLYICHQKHKIIDLSQLKSNAIKLLIPSISLIAWLLLLNQKFVNDFLIVRFANQIGRSTHFSLVLWAVLGGATLYFLTAFFIKSQEFKELFLKNKNA